MNRFTKISLIFTFLVTFLASDAISQKFAYVNSQQVLAEFPEVANADKQLETYQNQLIKKGQDMVTGFEAEYKKYMEEANQGTLSKVQMQQREGQLASKQEEIQKYELDVQQKIMTKREQLYKPILDKVQGAIDAIGAEEGYTMIFDSSTGTILHAADSDNITSKVKAKLGF